MEVKEVKNMDKVRKGKRQTNINKKARRTTKKRNLRSNFYWRESSEIVTKNGKKRTVPYYYYKIFVPKNYTYVNRYGIEEKIIMDVKIVPLYRKIDEPKLQYMLWCYRLEAITKSGKPIGTYDSCRDAGRKYKTVSEAKKAVSNNWENWLIGLREHITYTNNK